MIGDVPTAIAFLTASREFDRDRNLVRVNEAAGVLRDVHMCPTLLGMTSVAVSILRLVDAAGLDADAMLRRVALTL